MFDNLFKNSAPAKTPASGGLFNNLFATPTPAAKPTAIPANSPLAPLTTPATPAAPVTPLVAKPSPNPEASLTPDIPATALTGNLGGGYGTSNITDLPGQTSSNGSPLGKPLLTFINPAAKSSQLLSDRVAPAFDPTVPQKIDPSILENGRMPQSASDAVRKATGAQPDEQLDHLISLEIGGSNQPDNLNLEKLNSSGKQPSLTNENAIAKQVATGQISYKIGRASCRERVSSPV